MKHLSHKKLATSVTHISQRQHAYLPLLKPWVVTSSVIMWWSQSVCSSVLVTSVSLPLKYHAAYECMCVRMTWYSWSIQINKIRWLNTTPILIIRSHTHEDWKVVAGETMQCWTCSFKYSSSLNTLHPPFPFKMQVGGGYFAFPMQVWRSQASESSEKGQHRLCTPSSQKADWSSSIWRYNIIHIVTIQMKQINSASRSMWLAVNCCR